MSTFDVKNGGGFYTGSLLFGTSYVMNIHHTEIYNFTSTRFGNKPSEFYLGGYLKTQSTVPQLKILKYLDNAYEMDVNVTDLNSLDHLYFSNVFYY